MTLSCRNQTCGFPAFMDLRKLSSIEKSRLQSPRVWSKLMFSISDFWAQQKTNRFLTLCGGCLSSLGQTCGIVRASAPTRFVTKTIPLDPHRECKIDISSTVFTLVSVQMHTMYQQVDSEDLGLSSKATLHIARFAQRAS